MSAQWLGRTQAARCLEPLRASHLDAVMAIERSAYAVPWTRGNFIDSLASGYQAQCLLGDRSMVIGYLVAMLAVGEMHLLNLTVAPSEQGRGHARYMLDGLVAGCRLRGLTRLWLEVREGNTRARDLYRRYGMHEVGRRKGYYPVAADSTHSGREDAVVMSLVFDGTP